MPIANLATVEMLHTALNAAFLRGMAIDDVDRQVETLATIVTSSTAKELYPFLGALPKMREWTGDRQVNTLRGDKYELENKDFELTIAVDRNDIEDDQIGLFGSLAEDIGQETRDHRFRLLIEALMAGESETSYDGLPFFSASHKSAKETAQSNLTAGAEPAWYLFDTNKSIKPLLFQERKAAELVRKTDPNEEGVFWQKQLIWGVDARYAAGFGRWQLAHKAKVTLNEANLAAARKTMRMIKDTEGRTLNVRPNLLVVGPSLETTATKIVEQVALANGESNIMRGRFRVMVVNELG